MSEQPRHEDWCPCSQLIGAPMDDGESAEMGAFAWPADACVCGAVPVAPPLTAGPVQSLTWADQIRAIADAIDQSSPTYQHGGRFGVAVELRRKAERVERDVPANATSALTAGPVAPPPDDEEMVRHAFTSRTPYEPGDDRDIWCADCEYHREHPIHGSTVGEAPRGAVAPPPALNDTAVCKVLRMCCRYADGKVSFQDAIDAIRGFEEAARGAARPPQSDRGELLEALKAEGQKDVWIEMLSAALQRIVVAVTGDDAWQGSVAEAIDAINLKFREVNDALDAPARPSWHRCSGCGLRWTAPDAGSLAAELCGDCWRKVQPILHESRSPDGDGQRGARETRLTGIPVCPGVTMATNGRSAQQVAGSEPADSHSSRPPASPPALDPAVEAYQRERRQWFERAINGDNDDRSKWLEEYEVDVRKWLRDESAVPPEAPASPPALEALIVKWRERSRQNREMAYYGATYEAIAVERDTCADELEAALAVPPEAPPHE